MKKAALCIFAIIPMSIFIVGCDLLDDDYWTPAKRSLDAPWNIYLVGEKTTNTSGSVYGSGISTDTFDGTNVFKTSSYQYWQGGSKLSSSNCYITRIELHKMSWETYPVWRIFFKVEGLWHSESDFNNTLELDMRVPTTLNEKSLSDFVEIPK